MVPRNAGIAVFAVMLAIILSPIASSANAQESSWPMFRANLARTGASDLNGSIIEPALKWKFSYPGKTEGGKIHSSPAASDINGDGLLETVICIYRNESSGSVIALDCEGRMIWEYKARFSIVSSPSIADIDFDGEQDIIVGLGGDEPTFGGSGGVLALERDGTPKWIYEIRAVVRSSPAVADILPETPGLEIAIGAGALGDGSSHGTGVQGLHLIDSSGNLIWRYGISNWEVESSPAAIDMNGDGMIELIFGTDTHLLVALSGNGSVIWEHSIGEGYWDITSTPAVTDAEKNIPGNEIFFGAYDGKVRMLGSDGSEVWQYSAGTPLHSSICAADANCDGRIEVAFGGGNSRYIYMLSAENGSLLWKYPTKNAVYSSPAMADVDGDGRLETVVGSDDAILYAISADGLLVWKYEAQGGIYSSPAICDADGDGAMEIIFADDAMSIYAVGSDIDLAILKFSVVCSKNSNGLFSAAMNVVVKNLGSTKSPANSIWICLDGKVVLEESIPPISSGGSASLSRSFAIDDENGASEFSAHADPYDRISESDEENNAATSAVSIHGESRAGPIIPPLIIAFSAIGAVFRKRTFVGADFLKIQKKIKRYCPMFSTVEEIYDAAKYNPRVWSWLYSGCLRVVKPDARAYAIADEIRRSGRPENRILNCCAAMETGMNTIAFSEGDPESAAFSRVFGLGAVK